MLYHLAKETKVIIYYYTSKLYIFNRSLKKARDYIKQHSIKAGIYQQSAGDGLFIEGDRDSAYGVIINGDIVRVYSPL